MNDKLRLSRQGAAFIKSFEGCYAPIDKAKTRFKAYRDPIGVLTIGWGHTNHHGRPFNDATVWYKSECDAAFVEDMKGFEAAVKKLVTVPLTQNQFDALCSFAYNCGEGNLAKSTLLKKVNASDFAGAAAEFGRWDKAGGRVLPGLTKRRLAEARMFQEFTPDEDGRGRVDPPITEPVDPMPQQVDAPKDRKTTAEKVKETVSWVSGTGIMAALATFTDWKVVTAIGGFSVLGFLIWYFAIQKEP